MKTITSILACAVFAAGAIVCSDVSAQRDVNSAQEAAQAAKESLRNRRNHATSQIGWLDNVINAVNLNEPAYKDIAAQTNKAIEESRGR